MKKLTLIGLTFALASSAFAGRDLPELSRQMFKKEHEISAIKKKDGKRFLRIRTLGAVTLENKKRATMVKEILIPITTKVSIDERGIDKIKLKAWGTDLDLGTGKFYNTKNRLVEEIFDSYRGQAKGIALGAYHVNSVSTSSSGIQFNELQTGFPNGGVITYHGYGIGVRHTPFEVSLSPAGEKSTIFYRLIIPRNYEASEEKTLSVSTEKLLREPLPVIKKKTYPITSFGM